MPRGSRVMPCVATLALAVALVAVETADATRLTLRDDQGRPIAFDVRGGPVSDVNAYAEMLRKMWHGDEIADVVVQIGPATGGGGYYDGRGRITIPSDGPVSNAQLIHHEYGHHVDRSHGRVGCSRPPCWNRERRGGPRWFSARGLAERERRGLLSGATWETTLAEVWAEDYAAFHGTFDFYFIGWQTRPNEAHRRAIAADLEAVGVTAGGGPETHDPTPVVGSPSPRAGRFLRRGAWLVARRSGRLDPGQSRSIRFGGPRRALVHRARFTGGTSSVSNELVCAGRRLTGARGRAGRAAVLKRRRLPRGLCRIVLTNRGPEPIGYRADTRISRKRR